MIVNPFPNPPQQLWQKQTLWWLNSMSGPPPVASADQDNEETRRDLPPAAPAARCWSRVLPGL
jgi:hypothetical protein